MISTTLLAKPTAKNGFREKKFKFKKRKASVQHFNYNKTLDKEANHGMAKFPNTTESRSLKSRNNFAAYTPSDFFSLYTIRTCTHMLTQGAQYPLHKKGKEFPEKERRHDTCGPLAPSRGSLFTASIPSYIILYSKNRTKE